MTNRQEKLQSITDLLCSMLDRRPNESIAEVTAATFKYLEDAKAYLDKEHVVKAHIFTVSVCRYEYCRNCVYKANKSLNAFPCDECVRGELGEYEDVSISDDKEHACYFEHADKKPYPSS